MFFDAAGGLWIADPGMLVGAGVAIFFVIGWAHATAADSAALRIEVRYPSHGALTSRASKHLSAVRRPVSPAKHAIPATARAYRATDARGALGPYVRAKR